VMKRYVGFSVSRSPLFFRTSSFYGRDASLRLPSFGIRTHKHFFNRSSITNKTIFTKTNQFALPKNKNLLTKRTLTEKPIEQNVLEPGERSIRIWLNGCSALVFGIVVVGGITRLTESGLSMVEWHPLSGMIPPITEEDWHAEFNNYKKYPEYEKLNPNMTLNEFKNIFYWEWSHRMLGRAIGIAYGLPMFYFYARGYIRGNLRFWVPTIFAGICFQGLLGWYMVQSGLEKRDDNQVPRVSHLRLTAHLGSAFVIYSAMLWTTLGLYKKPLLKHSAKIIQNLRPFYRFAQATTGLIFTTALSGAVVAGLDAGLCYNEWETFPFMGEGLVPEEYWELTPAISNLLDNPSSVQFNHRALATTTFTAITTLWVWSKRLPLPPPVKLAMNCLFAMGCLQVTLGISTLFSYVQLHVASSHQAGSLTLLSIGWWLLRELKRLPK